MQKLCPLDKSPCIRECALYTKFQNRYYVQFKSFTKNTADQKIYEDNLKTAVKDVMQSSESCGINTLSSLVITLQNKAGRPTGAEVIVDDGECAVARFVKGRRQVQENHILLNVTQNKEGKIVWEVVT